MTTKAPWLSKTLWVNALAIVGSLIVYFGVGIDSATWATLSTSLLAAINVGLRMVTNEPIDWGGSSEG